MRAVRAASREDWDIRMDARVWSGVGEQGVRRRASVIRRSQVDSAVGSHLHAFVKELVKVNRGRDRNKYLTKDRSCRSL